MNEIYMFGCSCGSKGRTASIVKDKLKAKLYNTKRDSEKLTQHINFLQTMGENIEGYPAIVVENGGEQVTLLDLWKQPA